MNLIKPIRIIAIFIFILCIFTLGYCGYENLNNVRKSTRAYEKGVNEIIIEWTADYYNDKELLDRIDKDLAESQARLEKLGVEFD